jgi:hypothetical protein
MITMGAARYVRLRKVGNVQEVAEIDKTLVLKYVEMG